MKYPVTFVEKSSNRKLGKNVAATYASIKKTCPDSCKLKGNGCYAELSFTGIHNKRLDNLPDKLSATQIAREEARLIDESFKGKRIKRTDLRIHVSGDVRTKRGVKYLAAAANRYKKRGGGRVWTYSHAWANIPRKNWGSISVLASVDSIEEAHKARKAGYAPALVVSEFESDKAYYIDGIKFIPCVEQTRGISCTDCGLCLHSKTLEDLGVGIAFAIHGTRKNKFKLNVLKEV